ncbi:RNA polymerase sigma-70 factor [Dysgonomonas sp. Marseille-P4361]|uniref:RNA polymerase sigma-70 factor n=1 Tax=Dysgonomonas sp. Marseille-P4361 TaxID=2161820 RepID=UPI000D54FCD3|nr:RNA polymerase sigma-70 factor [Dysgonomonas sp. Marseille-P4361]
MNKRFETYFIENYPKVKSFAIRILLSEQDAEDITQDVFLRILDMPELWEEEASINPGFLYTITRNHIFNLLKRRSLERRHQESLFEKGLLIEEFGLEENIHAKELEVLAMDTIEKMPEQRKKIFKMSRFEGKTNKEISENLELSVRTVERHIYLALSELKKVLFLLVFY